MQVKYYSLVMMFFLFSSITCCAEEEEDARAKLESIAKIWQSWNVPETSRLSGIAFTGGKMQKQGHFYPDEFYEILEKVSLLVGQNSDLDALDLLTKDLFPNKSAKGQSLGLAGGWYKFSIIEGLGSLRVDTTRPSRKTSSRTRGPWGEKSYSPGARQANIHSVNTAIFMESASEFFYGPQRVLKYKVRWKVSKQVQDSPRITLTGLHSDFANDIVTEIDCDQTTGFIYRHTVFNRSGGIIYEVRQSSPVITNIGIPVGLFHCHLTYTKDGKEIQVARVYLLEKIDFDSEVKNEDFAIEVPKGTLLIKADEKKANGRHPAVSAPIPVADLRDADFIFLLDKALKEVPKGDQQ